MLLHLSPSCTAKSCFFVALASTIFMVPFAQAQSYTTYDDASITVTNNVPYVSEYAQMTLTDYTVPFPATGVCLTMTSPDNRTVNNSVNPQCPGYYVSNTIGDSVQLSFDATTTGNYSVTIRYDEGFSSTPGEVSHSMHIIGVGVSATNYAFQQLTGNTCNYTPQDCDSTPTCGAAQGYVTRTDSSPCYSYYLQQMGSIIYDTGARRCYALAYIPPNFFSGAQNTRATCN